MSLQKYTSPPRPPFDYSELIKTSFQVTLRHRYLWFFGLFTFGFGTAFGGGNFSIPNNFGDTDTDRSGEPFDTGPDAIEEWISAHWGLILSLLAGLVVLSILIWLWSVLCRGAVLGTVSDIRDNKPTGFRTAFARGRRSFGRLLLMDLLLLLVGIGLVIISLAVVLIVVFAVTMGGIPAMVVAVPPLLMLLTLLFTGLGCLALITGWIALGFIFNIMIILGANALVIEGVGPVEALRRGWRTMADNLTQTLLLYLLNTGLNIASGIATFLLVAVASVPAIIAWFITGGRDWPASGIAVSIGLSVLALAFLLVLVAAINTFFASYWTIAFRRLTGREPRSPGLEFET